MGSLVRDGDGVGGWFDFGLGQRFQLLPTIGGAQEKWIVLGVCVVVWGV